MSWFFLSLQKGKPGLEGGPVSFSAVYHFIRLEASLVLTLTCVSGGELILNARK